MNTLAVYGNNMLEIKFDPSGESICIPLLLIDTTIQTMVSNSSVITFGGDFITSQGDSLNHAGQLFNVLTDVSGLEKNPSNSFIVFPNPTADKIKIMLKDFSTEKTCFVKILDEIGREIFIQKINQPIFSVDFTGNCAGIYMVQVLVGEGNTLGSKRVVLR